jgi:hypothetical protein
VPVAVSVDLFAEEPGEFVSVYDLVEVSLEVASFVEIRRPPNIAKTSRTKAAIDAKMTWFRLELRWGFILPSSLWDCIFER